MQITQAALFAASVAAFVVRPLLVNAAPASNDSKWQQLKKENPKLVAIAAQHSKNLLQQGSNQGDAGGSGEVHRHPSVDAAMKYVPKERQTAINAFLDSDFSEYKSTLKQWWEGRCKKGR